MDAIFGAAAKALSLSEERSILLSDNVVNSSTPNYKARDIDFSKAMKAPDQSINFGLDTTHVQHIPGNNTTNNLAIQYRLPMQNSLDGNTVDPDLERKSFIENAMKYQVSLTFVQNKSTELLNAIQGQ